MLTQTGRYWKFRSKEELDSFLDDCIDSNDKFNLNFGISSKGEWYAYGDVTYVNKFSKQGQATNAEAEVKTF